ncbi:MULTISPECIES: AhpA/YtjB family protein [Aeromonas]|uniref:AhpA/YtjB family protein n=1 Tax=Aeromonas TaxID=642 RepID=UPI001C219562|nr:MULTISPECIES: AhpA/YtjB family protein [Aeromonas]QWZ81251.1 YtjB family periplasmic protein [Aeromonas sp. FDAARGOS 1414]UDN23529.1 YtjB family periplasmic protein [Aeromonas veronii]
MQRHLPIKRVLSLVAGLLLGCWVLVVLLHMQGESQAALHTEARNRAQALVAYAARDMKRWLKEENSSELERLARDLATEPEILDVTLYDGRGIPLAQSEQAVPLESLLPIGDNNKSMPEQGKGRIQFVQEVLDGDQTLGYLRITLEEQQMLADKDTRLKTIQEKQRLILLIALLAGLLISYGIRRNYMRVRKHKKRSPPPSPPPTNNDPAQ